ncbi:MAG: tetratricopeptide repeat-containing sensor histidine kinase, partial [Flavobacteriales bacterium]
QALPGQQGMERVVNLGNIAWELGMSDPQQAKPYGVEALALAERMADSVAIATAANDLAITEFRLGHLKRAVELNRRALRIRLAVRDKVGAAASHSKIAVAYTDLMVFDSALKHNYAAAQLYEELQEPMRLAQVRGNIGHLYQQMGDLERAESVIRQTAEELQPKGVSYALATNLGQLCQVLEQRGKVDDAFVVGQEALAMFTELGMDNEVASVNNELGMIARRRGDDAAGITYYRKALSIAERIGDLTGQATYGMNVANVLYESGRVKDALPYYARALELCRSQGYADQHMSLLGGYINALTSTGDLAGAIRLQSELIALKDTVYARERTRAVSDMQVKYETERTEKELLAAEARADEQRAVIERQRLRMILLSVGLAMLVVIAMLVIRLQRARHREQLDRQVIAEREQGLRAIVQGTDAERKRIASELHDGVGQLLTGLKYRMEMLASADPRLADTLALADEAGKEVRDIAHRMMPRSLEGSGLVPALSDMLNKALSASGVQCHFEHHGMEQRLAGELETGIYRIAQELLNNIIKHAKATRVDVQLLRSNGAVVLIVEDDGIGMDPARIGTGLGLRSLHDRARILHGILEFSGAQGRGTVATLRVPLTKNGDA